jgi:hypothetical protein
MARFCTRENEPLKKWNGVPIYLTTIITAVLVLGLTFSAVLQTVRSPLLLRLTYMVPGGDLNWLTAFIYPLIDQFSFFTPFFIFFFYWAAVGIESHLGRGVLTKVIALVVLVPAVAGLVMWYGFSIPVWLRGNYLLSAGIIIAFATLYPNTEGFGWIPFKWIAFACLVCGTFMTLGNHEWGTLVGLWTASGAAFLMIRRALDADHDDHVPLAARIRSVFRRKPKLRVVPPPVPSARRPLPTPAAKEYNDVEI